MKYEFHAQFPLALQESTTQAFAIEWLVGKPKNLPSRWKEIDAVQDPYQRLVLLAQSIVTPYKEQARTGTAKEPGGVKFWLERDAKDFLLKQNEWLKTMGLRHGLPDLGAFPNGAWAIHIPFTLRKPYLSKDDTDFYIIDNSVKKEWVFKVPYVAPSQWKGALRSTMTHTQVEEKEVLDVEVWVERRLQLTRLFGNERGVGLDDQGFEAYLDRQKPEAAQKYRQRLKEYTSTGFLAGRLHFYPTFFDQIGLEVINPHDRETGVGARGPILMECVPQGTTGEFTLLYVPFGPIEQSEDERRAEVGQDLQVLAKGVQAMLNTYGFGAKTSSGFGVAEERLSGEGKLVIRAKLTDGAPANTVQPEPQPNLPRYLESPTQLIPDLRREDGTLKSEEEYRRWVEEQGKKYKKKEQQLYEKAKKWWEEEGRRHWEGTEPSSEPALEQEQPETPAVSEYTFNSLSELCDLAQRVADQLREGGES